nr:A disintegrin and metalloproteinase with thrombospondin motifs 13-like isoform X1 [Dermacentor andersoni]
MLGASFMTYMASIQRSSLVLRLFLAFYITASRTGAASSEHSGWKISIVIFEDSNQQHPNNTVKSKEAYYEEMFNSVSRRLDLLSNGRFEFVRREYHPLSVEQSQVLFLKSGNSANIKDIFHHWNTQLAKELESHTHGKDLIILITKRTIRDPNGDRRTGSAVKGSMCTPHNFILLKDDGSFSAVNNIAKLIVHSFGVDMDGAGTARCCRRGDGFLMGTEPRLPLAFSECTLHLLPAALRKLTCLEKNSSSRKAKDLPLPPPISRASYCAALSSVHCDALEMGSLACIPDEEKLCFVFCCSGFRSPKKIVAPDGLHCGKDSTGIVDRRCINGMCEKIN